MFGLEECELINAGSCSYTTQGDTIYINAYHPAQTGQAQEPVPGPGRHGRWDGCLERPQLSLVQDGPGAGLYPP